MRLQARLWATKLPEPARPRRLRHLHPFTLEVSEKCPLQLWPLCTVQQPRGQQEASSSSVEGLLDRPEPEAWLPAHKRELH